MRKGIETKEYSYTAVYESLKEGGWQMIKLTLDNIVDVIIKLVPEFKEYEDFNVWDRNDIKVKRLIMGVFGRFFKERVENYPENDLVIQKVYKFLNEQFNESESDRDALDYLGIEVFENLSPSHKGTEVSKKLLKGKALESFNETAKYF